MPIGDRNHIYLFPGSVKHLHPEFDQAIEVILRTDPLAIVIFLSFDVKVHLWYDVFVRLYWQSQEQEEITYLPHILQQDMT